jgi:Flp pilus assembly protein TadD
MISSWPQMSSRNRRLARQARGSARRANAQREVYSGFARWKLAGICLALACAGLVIFTLRHYSRAPHPLAGNTPNEEPQKASQATGTNIPFDSSARTNRPGTDAGEDRIVALVTEGNRLLQQGNYAEAAHKFEEAVAVNPGDEDVHYNLAITLAKQGKVEEAKKHYAEALQIYPEYGDAHNNLGNLLMNEDQMEEAVAHFQEAARLTPENASFHNNLGTAFARQGKVADV